MTAAAKPTAPSANTVRPYWSSVVLTTCLRHAGLLKIIEWPAPGDTDLHRLPATIHTVVFTKCQELIDRACKAEAALQRRASIERRMNGELWDFLKTWRRDDCDSQVPRGTQQLNFGE